MPAITANTRAVDSRSSVPGLVIGSERHRAAHPDRAALAEGAADVVHAELEARGAVYLVGQVVGEELEPGAVVHLQVQRHSQHGVARLRLRVCRVEVGLREVTAAGAGAERSVETGNRYVVAHGGGV